MQSVLQAYTDKFGEREGILEFTKNYTLLKLLETEEEGLQYGFTIPEPYKIPVTNTF